MCINIDVCRKISFFVSLKVSIAIVFCVLFLAVSKWPSVGLKVTKLSLVTSDLKIVTVMSKVPHLTKNLRHMTHFGNICYCQSKCHIFSGLST